MPDTAPHTILQTDTERSALPALGGDPTAILSALGDALLDASALTTQNRLRAERVAAESGERFDRVLLRLGLVGEAELADRLAAILRLERVDRTRLTGDLPYVETLGRRFLETARLLPFEDGPTGVCLAVADAVDTAAAQSVAMKLSRPVRLFVATPSEVEAGLEALAQAQPEHDVDEDALAAADTDTAADVARLRDLASEAPVIRLVNQIIRRAVESRASDIHFEPSEQMLRLRYRIDGVLRAAETPPPALRAAIVSRLKIMAKLNIAEQRLPQDGRLQVVIAGREIDMRVATVPTLQGEGVVLRLLDRSGLVLDFDGLGFDADTTHALEGLIARPNGVVLVTGPTGSGKTTTLYAALSRLNDETRKIITVEDPVEYQLDGI
ncbi:MAG: ATPase, T2SS/T4P/T4SS family, partial [Pseudomonadota bacterium]